ncbi:MAG: hypothetical protein ACI83O_000362 [Patescibacteria group bacterium]|jgi:hypothetical protein
MLKIKGNEIEEPRIVDSFDRRAVKLENQIIQTLKPLGLERDDVRVTMEKIPRKKAPATVKWYFEGRNLEYTYKLMPKFIENLYVVDKVLALEVAKLMAKEISVDEFHREFSEEDDISDKLIEARKTLEVSEDEMDFDLISKNYKQLAKTHHPDMADGNHEQFQKINAAHKLIKKELT